MHLNEVLSHPGKCPGKWARSTGVYKQVKARQKGSRLQNTFLTILAISEVKLSCGSFAQVLSRCGGRGKAKRCSSWSGRWRRNLWGILVCLGCTKTVTCWRAIRPYLKKISSNDALWLKVYYVCVQRPLTQWPWWSPSDSVNQKISSTSSIWPESWAECL